MNGPASEMHEHWQAVTTLDTPVILDGREWKMLIEGQERNDGTWAGRLVFVDGATSRTTGQETSQPNREALEYWATGLEPVYLDGALSRAR